MFGNANLLRTLCLALLLVSNTNGYAAPVGKLLQEHFYHVAEKTNSGPTVHTGFNLFEDTGIYATSSAVFMENGFTHNFSTGYSGHISTLVYGLSYGGTQYNFDSLQEYYDQFSLFARLGSLEMRYSQDDAHAETEAKMSTDLGGWQVSVGSGQYHMLDAALTSYDFERLHISRAWQYLSFEGRLQKQATEQTQSYLIHQPINELLSNQLSLQLQDQQRLLNFKHKIELRKLSMSANVSQQWDEDHIGKRIHRFSLRKKFRHLDLQLNINDSESKLRGSNILLNYERVIDY